MYINHILKLARLEIEKKEKNNLEKDFSSILGFVKKIEKLNVSNVKIMPYPIDIYNVMLEDKTSKKTKKKKKRVKKLINAAPDKKNNYIKVKQVL